MFSRGNAVLAPVDAMFYILLLDIYWFEAPCFFVSRFNYYNVFSSFLANDGAPICDCGCGVQLVATAEEGHHQHQEPELYSTLLVDNYNNASEAAIGDCEDHQQHIISNTSGTANSGPSNGCTTAHTKVATSGGHANTQAPSKRSSSGADGDYQLVQHEVLYSLSAEYEVSDSFLNVNLEMFR